MKQEIKDLRVKIDGLAQLTKGLKPITTSKYTHVPIFKENRELDYIKANGPVTFIEDSEQTKKATDSLYLSKAWLGKVLGELGEDSPYSKDGTRKTVEDIEETADTYLTKTAENLKKSNYDNVPVRPIYWHEDIIQNRFQNWNHIQKVDWLRQEIQNIIEEVKQLHTGGISIEYSIARTNSYNYLCESRFQLGFELERIKENDKSN